MASAREEPLRLEPVARLEDIREEWVELAALAGHPFAAWEWVRDWWETFAGGRELYTFVCRDAAGAAVAILPLYVASTKPIRVARFLGYGDLLSPICAPEHRALAARALRDVTRRRPGRCPLVWAEHLPNEMGWGELVAGRVVGTHHSPVLRFATSDWDAFLAGRSKNFRDQVRRRERKIVRETGLTFRLADDPDRLRDDMDDLMRLHADRWGDESVGVFEGASAEFHHRAAADALEGGWLRLWLAEIDGRTVAAWYGWRFAGCEWYYQAGRDTSYDQLSLGFVLLAHTIRAACVDGMSAYHFLAGDEAYKARFTQEDPGTVDRLVGPAALTGAAGMALNVAHSMPPGLRRRLLRASN